MADPLPIQYGGEPQVIENDASPTSICKEGHTPLLMTGAILECLRSHFSIDTNIVEKVLQSKLWTEDTKTTGIVIEPLSKWPGNLSQAIGARPAIYIRRNQMKTERIGMRDIYQLGSRPIPDSGVYGRYVVDVAEQYGVLIHGSHTIFCIGKTAAEAEVLGSEVFYELLEFAPVIREDLDLAKLQIVSLDNIAKIEEDDEHWVASIEAAWASEHEWKLRHLGATMKST